MTLRINPSSTTVSPAVAAAITAALGALQTDSTNGGDLIDNLDGTYTPSLPINGQSIWLSLAGTVQTLGVDFVITNPLLITATPPFPALSQVTIQYFT